MTKVKFFTDNGKFTGFEVSGHSSGSYKDTQGKIVCAAVSSAAYLTANTCIEIIGAEAETQITDGFMSVRLNSMFEEAQITLEGFRLHIGELAEQYPKRIIVISEV